MFVTVCLVVCHEETAGQRELVYHKRFFNLSNLVLKARQLSPLFFTLFFLFFFSFALVLTSLGLLVFLTFAVTFKKPFLYEKTF